MINAGAILLVAFTSVFLLFMSTNSNATAIEKPGSDPTRPSESIETEEDTIQVDELGGNHSAPAGGKPDIETHEQDLSYNKVKVKFLYIDMKRYGENEYDCQSPSDACTDSMRDGTEFYQVAYVQGKKFELFDPEKNLGFGRIDNKEITVSIPQSLPFSIIIAAYEKDACRHYEYPNDISQEINAALSHPIRFAGLLGERYPELATIESNLNKDVNGHCVQDQDHHDVYPVISKVYEPLTHLPANQNNREVKYGEGTHEEISARQVPGYPQPLILYELQYQISLPPILAPEIDEGK